MSRLQRLWCRLTFRHRGDIVSVYPNGVRWMCLNCGAVER